MPSRIADRSRTRLAGRAGLAAAVLALPVLNTDVHAGDCEPTWDPDFGVPGIAAPTEIVFDFAAYDDGSGQCTDLYVSGDFTSIGGVAAARVAHWDGAAWQSLGSGMNNNEVYAIESYAGHLYAAGYFDAAGGVTGTAKLARWNGTDWESIGAQLELFSNQLWDLVRWDDGDGEALYIVGNYTDIGGAGGPSFVSRWDGTTFQALGAPIGGAVPLIIFSAYTWDDGAGEALYVGGRFLTIDGVSASRIAKWDGSTWSPLGTGLSGPGVTPSVMAMVAFDDGSGEALYVAGQTFTSAGGVPVARIARWDGSNWSAVGDGFADGIVWDLAVFDDGTGAALYAFGTFTASGATPLRGIARWDGTAWSAVDGGTDDNTYGATVFDDGDGLALYVGGRFTAAGGVAANGIARLSSCVETVIGDVTGDGVVAIDDLLSVLAAWGCVDACGCPGDANGDGYVDIMDLLLVLGNWS